MCDRPRLRDGEAIGTPAQRRRPRRRQTETPEPSPGHGAVAVEDFDGMQLGSARAMGSGAEQQRGLSSEIGGIWDVPWPADPSTTAPT